MFKRLLVILVVFFNIPIVAEAGNLLPDLVVTSISAPISAVINQRIPVSWTVRNQGNCEADANPLYPQIEDWWDVLYLSKDNVWDESDIWLVGVAKNGPLAAGSNYIESQSVVIPNIPVGNYFLLVGTDAWHYYKMVHIDESNENNNFLAKPIIISTNSTDIEVNVSVSLQGGTRPNSGWKVPLMTKFFMPGFDIPIYSFNLMTSKVGDYAVAQCNGILPGIYDITVVSEHTLLNIIENVMVSPNLYLGTLLEGNANNDDRINILDFGMLSRSYGKSIGQLGYDRMADFDRNGKIDIYDFGLLSSNYMKGR